MSEHALVLANEVKEMPCFGPKDKDKPSTSVITETGLEGALFSLLDKETDRRMCSHIQDTLISMLQALASEHLKKWLTLIKDVLQASSESSALNSPADEPGGDDKEPDDDEAGLHVSKSDSEGKKPSVAPRWPTRVFAIDCLLKVMAACDGDRNHFYYTDAKALRLQGKGKL